MTHSQKVERLLEFIKSQVGAASIESLGFCQLSGGAVQENYGLRVRMAGGSMPGEHRFVVRSDAPSSLSVSLTRPQEFEILRMAHAARIHTPQVFWLCTDHSLLGSDFYVMQWVPGSASTRNLIKDDGLTAGQRKTLLFQLGHDLALLHQIKYSASVLPFLAQPKQDAASQRIDEYRQSLRRISQPHPVIELGLSYLQSHAPRYQERVLCHCDFRTGNYLVENGNLTAILDWEFASWSDPYEDLGWMCAKSWRFGVLNREAGGVGDKADFFAGYESVSAQPVDTQRLAYWELMASVRWAVLALEQSQRHTSGQQESLELALTGRMLPEIERDLMSHLRLFLASSQSEDAAPASALFPDAVHGQEAERDSFSDLPMGASLLHAARAALLRDVLPTLPPAQHYSARMIARAMGIAMRELVKGGHIRQEQERLVEEFYRRNELGVPIQGLSGLAQDIRNNSFSKPMQRQLFALMDALLLLKLQLSNPKRLGS